MAVDEKAHRSSEIQVRITPGESQEFVKKLARDDDFRMALQERPLEILRQYHIELPEESIPQQVQLPPPKDVEELLSEMTELDGYGSSWRIWYPFRWLFDKIRRRK